ncbi:hypothetical protein C8R47DRAFT_732402 [Mycena vitilis]|nr:hypothetical protein C8R47DRAFT_732402 [Mycena vitilis]
MLKTSPQIAGRTLGYSLLLSPTDRGRHCVAREINTCNQDLETLAGLAHLYIYGLIRIFRNPKGPTPVVSPALSPRISFEVDADLHADTLVPAGATPDTLKEQIMARDRRRCVFTGSGDLVSIEENHPDVADIQDQDGRYLQVAHIISQSITSGITGLSETAQAKLMWASSASAILDRFAGIEVRQILGELDVHSPVNAILASSDPHILFDHLSVSLEQATDGAGQSIANVYNIQHFGRRRPKYLLPHTTFSSSVVHKGKIVEPPSPVLLGLHAACARIAHMSGVADILDKFDKDLHPYPVLSMGMKNATYNPSAAQELDRALHGLAMMTRVGA